MMNDHNRCFGKAFQVWINKYVALNPIMDSCTSLLQNVDLLYLLLLSKHNNIMYMCVIVIILRLT